MTIPDNISELNLFVGKLLDKIASLEARVLELSSENAALRTENAELKARLSLDSHNSSKPPSTDGLTKKPAFPREKTGKPGGQFEHKGKTLEMVENPDFIVVCKLQQCSCGQDLSQEPDTILARRQVFDIPEPHLEVTEYQIAQNTCPCCGKVHRGEFPENVNAKTQYGERMKAFTTLINNSVKGSFETTQTLVADMYGYAINEGTIASNNQICYEQLEPIEINIQQEIINDTTAHADESGVRCNGKTHWLHVISTLHFTYFFVHKNRGKKAIESEQSILKRFFGWLVHDCWASYFNLTHLKHAICGAHLLRELQAQIENQSKWANEFKVFLLDVFHTPIEQRLETRAKIELNYDLIISHAQIEEPQPVKTGKKGKLKKTKGRNLFERLQKFKPAVLAFAFNPEVPFTNNQAERDIRPVKVKQKISGCFRTETGAAHYARIAGFVSTVRKHNLNVFKELCKVFNNQPVLNFKTY